jgi:arylsulfatase A-like enzyme
MESMKRREFTKIFGTGAATLTLFGCDVDSGAKEAKSRPNILFLMSDNHYWEHLGCYGDNFVKTPNIDRLAREGVRFTNAYCAAPSCAPARASLLTGQHIWRLEEGASLLGILPVKFDIYTDLLRQGGYSTGFQGKGWGPGNFKTGGRKENPAGEKFKSFKGFLTTRTVGEPWTYWYSTKDTSRQGGREVGSGVASGMDPEKVFVPPYLPDCKEVRSDICDYYFTVQRFDSEVGEAVKMLEQKGQLENTLIVVCGDNGWQMPRGLANLYDAGSKIPLVISWKGQIPENRVVDDFVNLSDLSPTFLELAEQKVPEAMTAKSLKQIIFAGKSGRIEAERDFIVIGRERHSIGRQGGLSYPSRAIRTDDYLYIRNYEPGRWPAGDPPLFGDIDAWAMNYESPTKEYMMAHKDDSDVRPLYELAFLKRPAEELYDLEKDPFQMNNVAYDNEYGQIKDRLADKLEKYLKDSGDPRALGGEIIWDTQKYYGRPEPAGVARPRKEAIEKFGLENEYDFLKNRRN